MHTAMACTYQVLFALIIAIAICNAEQKFSFLKEAEESPLYSEYDYIVIGGGTAGCPLAATLSRDYKVLLVERGGVPYEDMNITRIERFALGLQDSAGDYSPAQSFISTDGVINTRPRVLGGGSALNAGFYSRASPAYVREAGWDGKIVNDSYPWVEEVLVSIPQLQVFQSALKDALLEVGIGPDNNVTLDHILGTKVGGSIFDNDGNRHTAADLLQYSNSSNIQVLLHSIVHRILFDTSGSRPRAYGIIYYDRYGIPHHANLSKSASSEVILSAGALGSPQLLMLSGIGPAQHLRSMGINPILDLQSVGKGMADNPMNSVPFHSPIPVEVSLIQVVGITNFGSFIEGGSGGFLTMDLSNHTLGYGGTILEKVVGPLSRGELYLVSINPNDNPRVTFNYFSNYEDLRRCVQGLEVVERILLSNAFRSLRYDNQTMPSGGTVAAALRDFRRNTAVSRSSREGRLERYCRRTVMTIWHYHGGCQVGRVVDHNYHVLGVNQLRVVDGSTFLNSPGTNPQATVMMLGRYMGLTILQERSS